MNNRKGKHRMSNVRPRNSRPTIGLLSGIGRSPYYNDLWAGFVGAASELDVNLICYVSGFINAPNRFDVRDDILYDLVTDERVDGLIISGTLGNLLTGDEFKDFINRYRPLPMVGVAQPPGIPGVVVDNEKGMRDIVTHFIEVHGYRRIAFIRGPEDNEEAALRYRGYADALAEHDVPLDPDLVAPGTFVYEGGIDAIRLLLDERKVEFDAVVASSDWAAFGTLKALEDRGICVPGDVAVGGFDGTREAAASYPSLTTVRQPIRKLGRASIEMMLKLLAGERVPEQTMLPTRLVICRSCGCSAPVVMHAAVGPLERKGEPLEEAIVAQREAILSEMVQVMEIPVSLSSEWAGRLLDAFVEEVVSDSAPQGSFLSVLDDVLRQAVEADSQVDDWQGAMSVMRRRMLPYSMDAATLSRAEDLFNQGRVVVGRVAQWHWARREVEETQQAEVLGNFGGDLVAAVEMEQIFDAVGHRLPQLGFSNFYLSLYEGQKYLAEWSRLLLAYDKGKRIEGDADGRRFLTRQLVPEELLSQERRYTWVVESLNFRENQFGCLVVEAGSCKGSVYGTLTRQISGALQDSLLLQRRRQAEEALARQARELTRSNEELQHFAYVASHDLQEPLRMVKSYLQLLERRYQGQLDEDADEFIAFAVDGAERMRILINDLLQYSRVATHGKPFAPTDCATVLDHALANLKVAIEESGAVVTHDSLPTVLADDVQLTQLLQNLIGNAIKFRKQETPPKAHVGVARKGGEWLFSVQDNGMGIEPQYFDRIFQIFQRLHSPDEYPGTGIGLAICKKIVERHGGRIWVESQPGQGSTFYFTIPDRGDSAS